MANSQAYDLLLQLAIVVIIVLFLFSEAGKVDVEFLQRTHTAQNLGLSISTISFLPTNAYYDFLAEGDKKMQSWLDDNGGFQVDVGPSTVRYHSPTNVNAFNPQFKYFVGTPPEHTELTTLRQQAFTLSKHDIFETKGTSLPHAFDCEDTKMTAPLHLEKGGREGTYYDKEGRVIEGIAIPTYEGFEAQYFVDDMQVWEGNPGTQRTDLTEAEILRKIADASSLPTTYSGEAYLATPPQNAVVLRLGTYTRGDAYVIAHVPDEPAYHAACNILNELMKNHPALLDGVGIIPTQEPHLLFEVGNVNTPGLYKEGPGNFLDTFGKALREGINE